MECSKRTVTVGVFHVDMHNEYTDPLFSLLNDIDFSDRASVLSSPTQLRCLPPFVSIERIYHSREFACLLFIG